MVLDTLSRLSGTNHRILCRYGLLFIIGVIFGSIGMFYRSFDITKHILSRPQSYVWSVREQTYVPLHTDRLSYSSSSSNSNSVQFVLILTYMRSGSSFTADVLQHHPDAFYAFEPLISIVHSKSAIYLNGTKRNLTDDNANKRESLKAIERWYNCDLYNIDIGTFRSVFMKFGIHTNDFSECVGKRKRTADMLKCLPNMIKACKRSKLRVIKTIRLNVIDILDFFQKMPNFKLIHLVRDPRGVMSSRMKVDYKQYPRNNLSSNIKYLCYEMATDMNTTFKLMKIYPERVTVLQYEDLAEHPYSTTARLYNFLKLDISLEIYGYIFCITSAGGVKERAYGIARQNSTSTANKWKTYFSYREIKLADLYCISKHPQLGYLPVKNSTVWYSNSTIATRINLINEINNFVT